MITDDRGIFTYVCPNTQFLFGLSSDEIAKTGSIHELMGGNPCDLDDLKLKKEIINIEWSLKNRSGHQRFVLINVKRVDIQNGTVLYVMRDITQQKQVEKELRKALDEMERRVEARTDELLKKNELLLQKIDECNVTENELREQKDFLNTLIETISSPIFYKNAQGKYTGCNRAFEDFIGRSRSEIIGKTVYEMSPSEIADKYFEMDQELFKKAGKQSYEWKVKRNDGVVRNVIFDKAALQDANHNVTGLVGVISDITKRKHAEDLVHNLSQMLLQAQERERHIIACELHDSIAQNLSTLKLYCTRISDDQSSTNKEMGDLLQDISRLIDRTITSVRDLAYDLRPSDLDHLGLVRALEIYCEEFSEKNNTMVDFQTAGIHGLTLGSNTQINLYRLIQEGLNNIRKHAVATKAVIRLVAAYPNIILRIEDNGKGFDVKDRMGSIENKKRMGLRSMQERVNLMQGQMSLLSQLNKGTKIEIKLLLKDLG